MPPKSALGGCLSEVPGLLLTAVWHAPMVRGWSSRAHRLLPRPSQGRAAAFSSLLLVLPSV